MPDARMLRLHDHKRDDRARETMAALSYNELHELRQCGSPAPSRDYLFILQMIDKTTEKK